MKALRNQTPNDIPAAIALGILSVSAYAVLRWLQIGAMIKVYVESERDWGDGRSGLASILLLFASPPMFLIGCVGVFFLHRSFIKANPEEQPIWNFLRSASTIMLTPFVLWIVLDLDSASNTPVRLPPLTLTPPSH